ncbi:MAG: hypothetical protein HYY09_08580 [Firmicutes bacterium]|nr:hypothetical protein [Bacillota bacterium]
MRIDKIEVCRLDLPFKEQMRVSFGVIPMARDILVRIYSDEGPAGISTATPVPYYLGQTQDTLLAAARFLAPLILGRDPFDIEAANHLMDRALGGNQPAKAAFDMALYDLIGKAAGRPIHDFLGGKVQ